MTFKGTGRPPAYKVDGKRVSGVTTILGNFTNPGGLIHWGFKTGQEHPDWPTPYGEGAAEIGTVCHKMVEKWIHKEDPMPELLILANEPDKMEQAEAAYNQFLEWWDTSGLRIVATEMHLTSQYGFGGTLDAVVMDTQDRIGIMDWKTAKSIYPDNLCQVAAYGLMWRENHPGVEISGGYHICRFAKEYRDFAHYHWGELDDAEALFLHLVEAHTLQKLVKKRI